MIPRASLVAFAVVTALNAAVLLGVSRDRFGAAGPGVWLDERELQLEPARENSAAIVRWRVQQAPRPASPFATTSRRWLDEAALTFLGFDCSVRPGDPQAPEFYGRQLNRRVFVVFDLASGDWDQRVAAWQSAARERFDRSEAVLDASARATLRETIDEASARGSRLVPVDAGLDLDALRGEYPDRQRHLVLPAVLGIVYDAGVHSGGPSVAGRIHEVLPSEIQVPSHARGVFVGLDEDSVTAPARRLPGRDVLAGLALLEHRPRFRVKVDVSSQGRPRIEEAQRLP